MKNIVIRSISGIVYIAAILAAIFCGRYTFFALCILLTVAAMIELQHMCMSGSSGKARLAARILDIVTGIAICSWSILPSVGLFTMLIAIPIYLIARFIISLYDTAPDALASVAYSILSLCYIAFPLALLQGLYDSIDGNLIVLMLFIMIWLNDTGAYCVGCSIGRRRLFERLSPKKSWEGFWGGFIASILAGVAADICLPGSMPLAAWIGLGATVSIAATLGDLFESMIKRTAGVKDSSHLIPGHGGVLDRIDSLLFVAPVATCYALLIALIR